MMVNKEEDQLTERLYRRFCPDPVELGEYSLQMLAQDRMTAIRLHLETCPHCRDELSQLQNYLEDLAPSLEYSLLEKVKIWIARQLPEVPQAGLGMAPAYALRGRQESGEESLSYQAGEALVSLERQSDPDLPGKKTILGLVSGTGLVNLQAILWQNGQRLSETGVDEIGNFVFSHLEQGQYELILASPDVEIHIQELTL